MPYQFNAIFVSLLHWSLSCVDFILLLLHSLFSNSMSIRLFPFFGFSSRVLLLNHIKSAFFYITSELFSSNKPSFEWDFSHFLTTHCPLQSDQGRHHPNFPFPCVHDFPSTSLLTLSYLLLTLLRWVPFWWLSFQPLPSFLGL